MTRTEAWREARRRWGVHGFAWESTVGSKATPPRPPFRVGVWANGPLAYGCGFSYEAAFSAAERNPAAPASSGMPA